MQKVEPRSASKKKVPALAQLFQPLTNCNPVVRLGLLGILSVTNQPCDAITEIRPSVRESSMTFENICPSATHSQSMQCWSFLFLSSVDFYWLLICLFDHQPVIMYSHLTRHSGSLFSPPLLSLQHSNSTTFLWLLVRDLICLCFTCWVYVPCAACGFR